MKKFIAIFFVLLLSVTILCGFKGCEHISDTFFDDGDFTYYYVEEEDCYAIVDTTRAGFRKETLVVPAYYQGKELKYTAYKDNSLAQNYYGIRLHEAEKSYLPYTHEKSDAGYFHDVPETVCFCRNDKKYVEDMLYYILDSNATAYVSPIFYQNAVILLGMDEKKTITYTSDFSFKYNRKDENDHGEVRIANTSYHFNYEGAPNDNYFFVNDFERGGRIENTPYEPQRKGCKFAGWYKERDCLNAWDFENDTLPAAEYDEQGNLIFAETKLFAKWTKN